MRVLDDETQRAMSLVATALDGASDEVAGAWDVLRRDIITDHVAARVNTPEIRCFLSGIENEVVHQQERWGESHDADKGPFDWFWLIGYLSQKAADAAVRGDIDKAMHHTITTAAALANWHRLLASGAAEPTAIAV